MTGTKRALIAVTSYNEVFYEDGAKTGIFSTEALHPYNTFIANGYEVDFVSETGKYGFDEHSLGEPFLVGEDAETFNNTSSKFRIGLDNIKTPHTVNASDYEIFFVSAGHGTLFDYPKAKGLQSIASEIYDNGGAVGAVCHGYAIFDGLIEKKTGKPLISGKSYTGFTSEGEVILKVDNLLKEKNLLFVEDLGKKYDAKYLAPSGPWDDFSIADGRVVTGVNPQSAHSTAKRTISALKDKHSHTEPQQKGSSTVENPDLSPSKLPGIARPTN